jgi:hypothetical protein
MKLVVGLVSVHVAGACKRLAINHLSPMSVLVMHSRSSPRYQTQTARNLGAHHIASVANLSMRVPAYMLLIWLDCDDLLTCMHDCQCSCGQSCTTQRWL